MSENKVDNFLAIPAKDGFGCHLSKMRNCHLVSQFHGFTKALKMGKILTIQLHLFISNLDLKKTELVLYQKKKKYNFLCMVHN